MNVSPKRMAQINAAWARKVGSSRLRAAVDLFTKDEEVPTVSGNETSIDQFIAWLGTDPAPAPLTLDDLSDEDRAGYVLARSFNDNPTNHAESWYLTNHAASKSETYRTLYNTRASVVAAEARRQIERDYVLVPRARDEDADLDAFDTGWSHNGGSNTAGIRAVLDRHDTADAARTEDTN